MNEDILTHGETMSEEQLLEGLRKTPELKRRLVMRVAADLLESEAFLEAYPHLETEEQIKTALTRLLHKNKVSTIDGRRMAAELAESYEGMYSHSDRSEGPASGMNPIRHSLLHDKKHCRLLPAACRKPPKLFRYGTGRKCRQSGARSSKCRLVSDKST